MATPKIFSNDYRERTVARADSRMRSSDRRVRESSTMFMDFENEMMIRGSNFELSQLDEVKKTINWLYTITKPKIDRAGAPAPILLSNYNINVFGVYTGAQPNGFDFLCPNIDKLFNDMNAFSNYPIKGGVAFSVNMPIDPVFNIDTDLSFLGGIAGLVTAGTGYRQISTLASLHVELSRSGVCNIHIDKAGIVCGVNKYNLSNFLNHGIKDLIVGYLPPSLLYGSHGDVTWTPDLQLKLDTDTFKFGPNSDFHDQSMLNEKQLGWSIIIGTKITFNGP